jgi:plasmid stability protein
MSRMIQVRHVPDDVHRRLKTRAAASGVTLSDYLRLELDRIAERPSPEELRERLGNRSPVRTRLAPARVLRQERDRR